MDHSTISYTIFNFLLGSNQKWFQCTFEPQMIDRERRSRTGVEVVVVAVMHFALFVLGCNPVQDHKRSNFGIHSVILGQYKLFGLAPPRTFANLE